MERQGGIRRSSGTRGTILFVLAFLLTAGFVFSSPVYGQQSDAWALKMFTKLGTERSYNFGNLALHAEAEHRFIFENIYKEDVEILSAQSNCGCTKVSVTKKVVKSREKAEIIARVDTSGKVHKGKRKVTITVHFNRPKQAEVQLQIQAFIRSDVVFSPGNVEFGGVAQGRQVNKKVYLEYHGGDPNWNLLHLNWTHPGIMPVAKLVSSANGIKTYEVTVTLKDSAEPGYLSDLVQFISNDGENQSIFIPVHAQVLAPLTAKPSYFQLGIVHPGEEVSKNLVIRGSTPFKIEKISSTDSRLKFLTANQKSAVHVIPVTFSAGDSTIGPFHQVISVKTTQEETPELEISVSGFISDKPRLPQAPTLTMDENPARDQKYEISRLAKNPSAPNAPAIPMLTGRKNPTAVAFSTQRAQRPLGTADSQKNAVLTKAYPFGGILTTEPAQPQTSERTSIQTPEQAVESAQKGLSVRKGLPVAPSPLRINPLPQLENAAAQADTTPDKEAPTKDESVRTSESDSGSEWTDLTAKGDSAPAASETASEKDDAISEGWVAAVVEPSAAKNESNASQPAAAPASSRKQPQAARRKTSPTFGQESQERSGSILFRKPALAGEKSAATPSATVSTVQKTAQAPPAGETNFLLTLPE